MGDYISREAAIEAITADQCYKCPVKPKTCFICKTSAAKRQIRRIPAAKVRPVVKSRWIEIDDYVLCANCGVAEHSPNKNYCPNCGADMRGGGEDG